MHAAGLTGWFDRLDLRPGTGRRGRESRAEQGGKDGENHQELCGFQAFALGSVLVKKLMPQFSTCSFV